MSGAAGVVPTDSWPDAGIRYETASCEGGCLPVILHAHARLHGFDVYRFGALTNFLLRPTVTYCVHAVVFSDY